MPLSQQYWNSLYTSKNTGWDIGYVSMPIKEYFDQLVDKNKKILIPGAGKAWEAEYIYNLGFKNLFVLDFSEKAVREFKNRCPWFPKNQIIHEDFFKHNQTYDLIVEQTFFSSILPADRQLYVNKVYSLLEDGGKYIGILFNHEFNFEGPPFGGTIAEYKQLFINYFDFEVVETAYNSIKPRKGREVFLLLRKK
jgi:hypothetical protein